MDEIMVFFKSFDRSKIIKPLTGAYILFALVEIIAESNRDMVLIPATKPFLMPLLIALYWCASKRFNPFFVLALVSAWLTNLFMISEALNMIVIGAVFFFIYRLLVMYVVFRTLKYPGNLLMIIGCLPFLFLYLFLADLTYPELGKLLYLFILQCVFMIAFGGFCLGNYILKANKTNTYLLISTLFLTATQFIIIIKIFYISFGIFQPIAVLLFVAGQFLLYKYMLLEEKRRKRIRQVITK